MIVVRGVISHCVGFAVCRRRSSAWRLKQKRGRGRGRGSGGGGIPNFGLSTP
jgi:hypothetical protein